MSASETMVRMGELAVSSVPGDVLVSLGLGSCIGLALLDHRMRVAGLAHIVLPESQGHVNENPRKFADLAVPQLVTELARLGPRKVRLEAVLVGGASMFTLAPRAPVGSASGVEPSQGVPRAASSLEVGQRNEAAVRELLMSMRIPVVAAATGGNRGRTIRVDVATGAVTVREAGGKDTELLAGTRAMEAVA
jgi:chemotaxis protein CheD